MDAAAVKANIWKLTVFHFLDMFAVFLPFIVYYFQELGFSLGQIAILQSSMAITLFVAEIPSGYIADRFGRKNSLIIGVVLQIASIVLLYTAQSYGLLILSHVLLGLCMAFLSGADSALLYDSLLVLKKEQDFKKIDGRIKFYAELAIILSAVIGSLIVGFGIKLTILITLIGHILLLLVSFMLTEPDKHKLLQKIPLRKELHNLLLIVKRSVYNKKLLGLFLYSFIVLGVSNTIFLMYQPYFRATGIDVSYNGLIFGIFSVATALAAYNAHKIEKKLGVFNSLLIMPLFLVIALLGSSIWFVWFGFLFFLLRELVRGFIFPVLGDYTNKLVISTERATVLSVGSMFSRLGLVVISTTFGFFSDVHGMQTMLLITGLSLLLFTGIVYFLMRNHSTNSLKPHLPQT